MGLTPEQKRLWDRTDLTLHGNEGQTLEQARNFAIAEFQHICALEGLGIPPDEDVAAELDKLPA